MERVHLTISGRVQGVGYRAFARGRAKHFGLTGWVRNLADGRVEAVAEGPRDALEAFIAYCRRGPLMSRVSDVAEVWQAATGEFQEFDVRH